ncbi:MAG: LacI family DNA-binding transcriptional regulator [Lachnospiraceae bacterium]|nr:LacI family DNA-binding transcriptional regulator [Lachnospiraceae bacterium]
MAEITIKDIAEKCGVGIGTVSRAINNHPNINSETRERVLAVIKEMGYIPNNSARNLKRTDAKCIAVLIKGIINPFFSTAVQTIEAGIQKAGYSMVMQHVEAYENEVEVALQLIKEKRLRGIIFLGGAFVHDKKMLDMMSVPFIFSTIGGAANEDRKQTYSNVSVDDRAESKKMVRYLLELGHRDIAILTEDVSASSVGQLRLEGYWEAFTEKEIAVNEKLIWKIDDKEEPYSMENGYAATKKLLESGEKFTALFAISDFLAIGACRALREAGLKIPEDVSVAGFDGIAFGEYFNPQLTTIRQPIEEMSEKTVQLLLDVIEEKCGHEHLVFPARLTIRESTAPCNK